MKSAVPAFANLCVGILVLLTISHLFSSFSWLADLIELFRPYIFAATFIPVFLFLFSRKLLGFGFALLLSSANIALVCSPLMIKALPAGSNGFPSSDLKLVTFNCLGTNPAVNTFVTWVRRSKPDVIALQEIPDSWNDSLEAAKDVLPYRASLMLKGGNYETDIYSRYPITEVSTYVPTSDSRRAVHAVLTINGHLLDVFAIHPNTLRDKDQWANRNAFLGLAGEWISTSGKDRPRLVMGDWNLAPWSPFFARFLRAAAVRPLESVWLPPATRILGDAGGVLIGSPIDHIAANGWFESLGCEIGPDLRSDHRPLLCRARLH